jgi:hypothetical protein
MIVILLMVAVVIHRNIIFRETHAQSQASAASLLQARRCLVLPTPSILSYCSINDANSKQSRAEVAMRTLCGT